MTIKNAIKRLRCRHGRRYLEKYYDIYSDFFGYECTKFVFRCSYCGKRHVFRTRVPDYFLSLLRDASEKERGST